MAPWSACFPYNLFFSFFSSVFALCGELSRRLDLDAQRALTLNVYNNNYQVFEHKPMVVSDDSDQVNMLVREREVGNVFRMFRNPDEYDASPAPTAIKVIDHDKQRWATLTLGEVLARTGVWSGQSINVRDGQPPGVFRQTGHIANGMSPDHPLRVEPGYGFNFALVIGDLEDLKSSTIRSAVKSLERTIRGLTQEREIQDKLNAICQNNVWGANVGPLFEDIANNMSPDVAFASNIGSSAATASVEEVADSLQRAMVDSVAPDGNEDVLAKAMSDSIMGSINNVVSATSEMTDSQRGSIASAFVGAVANFKSSKSALKKVLRNADESKQRDLESAYTEAIKKDFKTNWKTITTEAKKIAAKIGVRGDGTPENFDAINNKALFKYRFGAVENMGFSRLQKALARFYLGCSIDLPTIVSLDEQGIVVPFGAYVFRPFQSFQMGSAVVM